jgi:glycosyl transferase family 25
MITYILGVEGRFRGDKLVQELMSVGQETKIIWAPPIPEVISQYNNPKLRDFAQFQYGRYLKAEEISCALGHRQIYENFKGLGENWALVLEDDAILKLDPRDLISELPDTDAPCIILLHEGEGNIYYKIRLRKRLNIFGTKELLVPRGLAVSYLINKAAAKIALQSSKPNLMSVADWPYIWQTKIGFYESAIRYFEHPNSPDASVIGLRVPPKSNLRRHLPSIVRLIQGMNYGTGIETAYKQEFELKYKILLWIAFNKLRNALGFNNVK